MVHPVREIIVRMRGCVVAEQRTARIKLERYQHVGNKAPLRACLEIRLLRPGVRSYWLIPKNVVEVRQELSISVEGENPGGSPRAFRVCRGCCEEEAAVRAVAQVAEFLRLLTVTAGIVHSARCRRVQCGVRYGTLVRKRTWRGEGKGRRV